MTTSFNICSNKVLGNSNQKNSAHFLLLEKQNEAGLSFDSETVLDDPQKATDVFAHNINMTISNAGKKTYTSVDDMYDAESDLSTCPLFKGGYINFGYWEGVDLSLNHILTDEERIISEKNLYRRVFEVGELNDKDFVLEVGSGLGLGSCLALSERKVKKITGMDLNPEQISRALRIQKNTMGNTNKLEFLQGSAEKMPIQNNSFSKVFSVEAAQHFRDISAFLSEAHRVLHDNGKLIVTTFFSTSEKSIVQLKSLIPTINEEIDKVVPVDYVLEKLVDLGFTEIKCQSIGNEVWKGFDKWIAQGEMRDTWNVNWIKSFNDKLVDYYIISARK